MERPKMTSMMLASEWVTHTTNERAWDEMREIVESEPERAWRIIQTLVGIAPDYDVLSAVAAGPLEDLLYQHGDSYMPVVAAAARASPRLRMCLRAAHSDLPPELADMVEAESADVRDQPVDQTANASGDDLAVIFGWLHHSDTAWTAEFLKDMTENDPAAAWDVLRVLAIFADEDSRIQEEIYDDAFKPFIRRNFAAFREKLVALGRKSVAFKQWLRDQKRLPIDDGALWKAFVTDIASA